jgi:hypothetical protein
VKPSLKKPKPKESEQNGEIRFSIKRWAGELGCITQPGLSKALHKAGQVPDAHGRYSTAQIRETLWGPAYEQRIALLHAKTEGLKQKLAEKRAQYILIDDIPVHQKVIYDGIAEVINSCRLLNAQQKSDLLRHLERLK